MFDELLSEEERQKLTEFNEETITRLQKQGIRSGKVMAHMTPDRTLIVRVRGDRPGEVDEYMFFPNGKFFEKVN